MPTPKKPTPKPKPKIYNWDTDALKRSNAKKQKLDAAGKRYKAMVDNPNARKKMVIDAGKKYKQNIDKVKKGR